MGESLASWARSVYRDQQSLVRRLKAPPAALPAPEASPEPVAVPAVYVPSIADLRKKIPGSCGILYRYVTRVGSRFMAHVRVDGSQVHLGTFDTQEEAAAVILAELLRLGRDPRAAGGNGGRPSTRGT